MTVASLDNNIKEKEREVKEEEGIMKQRGRLNLFALHPVVGNRDRGPELRHWLGRGTMLAQPRGSNQALRRHCTYCGLRLQDKSFLRRHCYSVGVGERSSFQLCLKATQKPLRSCTISHKDTETLSSFSPSSRFCFIIFLPPPPTLSSECSNEVSPGGEKKAPVRW